MPVAVVDELEVVDVQQRQSEGVLIARGGRDGPRELVLEGPLVGKVGQTIAGGSLQDHAMIAHRSPPAEEIEDGPATEQREQTDQGKDTSQLAQLHVVGAVAVDHLVGVAAAGEGDREDELEVAAVAAAATLASGIGIAVSRAASMRGLASVSTIRAPLPVALTTW